jgi:hypothetical protein
MGDVDADQRRDPIRVLRGDPPGHRRADARAHEMKGAARVAQRVGDLEDVLRVLLHVVGLDALRPGPRAEPAQVGRHGTEAHLGHGGNLVMPFPTVAGQAVQQEQQGPIYRAVGQGLEGHAACLDLDFLQRGSPGSGSNAHRGRFLLE